MSIQMREYRGVPQDAPAPTIVRVANAATRTTQQDETGWMSIPIGIPNCPEGLEYLTALDELFIQREVLKQERNQTLVQQQPEQQHIMNKYCVKNAQGQHVYFGLELGNRWQRRFLRSNRSFEIQIVDNFQNVVLQLKRPLRCNSCLYPCCMQEMLISAPSGTVIGSVQQVWSPLRCKYILMNVHGEVMLSIRGPYSAVMHCMRSLQFQIFTVNGNEIGNISKDCAGPSKGLSAQADYFGVTFPMDIDVRMKSVILGATFLIGLLHF